MIESFLGLILILFVGAFIVVPVCVNIFKEQMWRDTKERIKREAEYEQLVKDMKKKDIKKGKK